MKANKGVILAGGQGERLMPITQKYNKHMLPLLNLPMVQYPLETLKSFGIKDILIITGGNNIGDFAQYFGDGSKFNVNLTYKVQKEAKGIADALLLAEDFVDDYFTVILGDNYFDTINFIPKAKPTIFLKQVEHPERFGVYYPMKNIIIEKPIFPETNFAVTGLYHYDKHVFDKIKTLQPSKRGELEITDINNWYLSNGNMNIVEIDSYWHDCGTIESKLQTENYIFKKVYGNNME